jgi:hypothetical protein
MYIETGAVLRAGPSIIVRRYSHSIHRVLCDSIDDNLTVPGTEVESRKLQA